jgi:hypothetical protein
VASARAPASAAPRLPAAGHSVGHWRAARRYGRHHRGHDRRRPLAVCRAVPARWRSGGGGTGLDVSGAELRLVAIGRPGPLRLRVADEAVERHHPGGAAGPARVRVPEPGAAAVRELARACIVGASHVSISIGVVERFEVTIAFAVALTVPFTVAFTVFFPFAVVVFVDSPAVHTSAVHASAVHASAVHASAVHPAAVHPAAVHPAAVVLGSGLCDGVVCAGLRAKRPVRSPEGACAG